MKSPKPSLTVVIPCFNEEATIIPCLKRVLGLKPDFNLEVLVVDDGSTDGTLEKITAFLPGNEEVRLIEHPQNRGKGSALKTGFSLATGEVIAIQDADLEYNPSELPKLAGPILSGHADMVIGSRFLSTDPRRVLYFWHSLGNHFLTFLSNLFTDLNLTDMESCYKVFRADLLKSIDIEERGFGVEPELVAKTARLRPRIFEMGISYFGRTYAEGKKIGWRDGLRAIYCIFHYNGPYLPIPLQFLVYLAIGGLAGVVNLGLYWLLFNLKVPLFLATLPAFLGGALVNYHLCIHWLFRHQSRWPSVTEQLVYWAMVALLGLVDYWFTSRFLMIFHPLLAKGLAAITLVLFNYLARRVWVFPEAPLPPWSPQQPKNR